MPTQNFFDQISIFVNSYQHAKNQFFHLFILQILSVLESHHKNGHTHFLTMHNFFNRLLICMNLYQMQKPVNSIC